MYHETFVSGSSKKLANIFCLFRKTLNLIDSLKFKLFVLIGSQNSKDFHTNIGIGSFFILPNPQEKTGNFFFGMKII